MFSIDLESKVVWITGGSRGIGQAIAREMARANARVVISYHRREQEAEYVAKSIELEQPVLVTQINIADQASCEQAYGQIKERFGPVDILVNNAGVTSDGLFYLLGEEQWDKVLSVNLLGTVNVIRTVVTDMLVNRYGRIINISSVAAQKPSRGQANYAVTKAGIEALSRSLAVEFSAKGIHVNCIAPGVIETDMSAEVRDKAGSFILERQLLKRFGKPEDVAGWAVFLASRYADFMTGEVIHVDGGLLKV